MKISTRTTFDKKEYKLIRKKEYNEDIVLRIMNDSKIVFPDSYEHITIQDHGEADYRNLDTGEKYDLKLLFEGELCQALFHEKYNDFLYKVDELIGIDIVSNRDLGPKDLELYKVMVERINKISNDERGILFLPYNVTLLSSTLIPTSDIFDFCFRDIDTDKEIFLIVLNEMNEIVIRKLGINRKIEYLQNNYFKNWLDIEIVGWSNDD